MKNINYLTRSRRVPKAIYGALISAGVGMASSLISKGKEEKQLEEERARQSEIANSAKFKQDEITASNFENQGSNLNSFYMKEGGRLAAPPSFDSIGGDLNRKSSNTEEAVGNTHEENTIDNTNGIKLMKNNQTQAEVEDDEIIKDGDMVFSATLTPKGEKETFADIVDKLTTRKGKLEDEIEEAKTNGNLTMRKNNSLSRQIEIINDKENALFEEQEALKAEQNIQPQYASVDNNETNIPNELLSGNNQNETAQLQQSSQGEMQEPQMQEPMPNKNQPQTFKKGGKIIKARNGTFFGGQNDENDTYDFGGGTFGTSVAPYVDNAVNLVNTLTKPRVPKPILTRTPSRNTRVDVNNQLDNIDQAVERTSDFIADNSSNSNTARGNAIRTRMQGANQKNQVLANKNQQERTLENQAIDANLRISSANNNMLNNYNNSKLARDLSIRKEISDNVANSVDDYGKQVQYADQNELIKDKNELYKEIYTGSSGDLGVAVDLDNPQKLEEFRRNPAKLSTFMENLYNEDGTPKVGKQRIEQANKMFRDMMGRNFVYDKDRVNNLTPSTTRFAAPLNINTNPFN